MTSSSWFELSWKPLTCMIVGVLLLWSFGCVSHAREHAMSGVASWYGPGFHGRRTACGQRYKSNKRSAAHRTLRCGTLVRVTRVDTGAAVLVRINDRGPFVAGRVIDLSRGAARKLGMLDSGLARVRLEVVR